MRSFLRVTSRAGRNVVDVGSGAGGPGLALHLARPDLTRDAGRAAAEAGLVSADGSRPAGDGRARVASCASCAKRARTRQLARRVVRRRVVARHAWRRRSGSRSERGSLAPRARCGSSWPASPPPQVEGWKATHDEALSLAAHRRRAPRGALRAFADERRSLRLSRDRESPARRGLHGRSLAALFDRLVLRRRIVSSGADRGGLGEWTGCATSKPSATEQPTFPSSYLGARRAAPIRTSFEACPGNLVWWGFFAAMTRSWCSTHRCTSSSAFAAPRHRPAAARGRRRRHGARRGRALSDRRSIPLERRRARSRRRGRSRGPVRAIRGSRRRHPRLALHRRRARGPPRRRPGRAKGADGRVARRSEIAIGVGPVGIERVGDRLIVNCVLDHALVIQKLDPSGAPASEPPIRIVQDGPIWSFAAQRGRAAGC